MSHNTGVAMGIRRALAGGVEADQGLLTRTSPGSWLLVGLRRPPINHRVRAIVAHPDNGAHSRPKVIFGRFDQRPILRLKWGASEQEPLGRVAAFRVTECELLSGVLIGAQTNYGPI